MKSIVRYMPYAMWGCAVSYYLFQYIIRVSPGVMKPDLMMQFQVNAHGFGTLCAIAMYTYGIMQVPVGFLTDYFGARRVILWSILSCIGGVALFAAADTFWQASIGRAFIGIGSAAAFLGVNKVGSDWFPANRRAFVFDITMTMGTIGATMGGAPLAALVNQVTWRQALLVLCGIGVVVFIINFLFLKAQPDELSASQSTKKSSLTETWNEVRQTLSNRQVWVAGLTAMGIYLAVSVLADLWGVGYLMQTYGIENTKAAFAASLIYVGLCFGALLVSWWSDRISARKKLIVFLTFSLAGLLAFFLYMPVQSFTVICCILFFIGFCSGAEMLCFALATEWVSRQVSGTVTGFINGIVTFGCAIVQQQVGKILDYVWCGQCTSDGLRLYTTDEYRLALTLMVIVVLLSGVAALFLREARKGSSLKKVLS